MNFNEYCNLSARTDNTLLTIDERIENYTISLFEEVGEAASILKKAWYQGHVLELEDLIKEFGDCFWYISQLKRLLNHVIMNIEIHNFERKADKLKALMIEAGFFVHNPKQDELSRVYWMLRELLKAFDISFEVVLIKNIAKLEKRYPEKFSVENSVNRVE